jgi:hypothetical protein
MKNLEELIQIVTLSETKKTQISDSLDMDTKLFHLFRSISQEGSADGKFIFQQLYEQQDTGPFRVLKFRLREKLLQEALRIDPNKAFRDPCDVANHRCWRNLLLAQLLLLKFKRNAAIDILKQTIKQAKKFQLTNVLVTAARTMRYHAAYAGSSKGFAEFDRLLNESMKNLDAEMKVEELSQQMILDLHHKLSLTDSLRRKEKIIFQRVEKLANAYPTFQNKLNLFRVSVRYYQMINHQRKVLEWCNKAENYFDRNQKLVQQGRRAEFALYKMYSSFALTDFTAGEQCAATCENLFRAGTDNWLIFQEYYFLLSMHTGNFFKATEIFSQVNNHPKFQSMPAIRIEKWKIFEAYLHFVLPDALSKKKFNLFKFINEVPTYSQDKSGFNLSILIARILLLINLGKYNDLMAMEDGLTAYCNRHLRKSKNHRSYYFMKMILVLIKYYMDPDKSEQIAAKFLARMRAGKIKEQSTEEMEVIPYESLWALLLQRLAEKEQMRDMEEIAADLKLIRA